TGETGAGKSILIGALSLLLGGRHDPDTIRSEADSATVEARFANPSCIAAECDRLGIDLGGELILRRRVDRCGRGAIHANDTTLTVSGLEQLGDRLVDLHGQHQHQLLLRTKVHMETLDAYAETSAECKRFASDFADCRRIADELSRLQKELSERQRRRDLTEFQFRELADANIQPDEATALRTEQLLQQSTERRFALVRRTEELLSERDESVLSLLAALEKTMAELAKLDESLAALAAAVVEARVSLDDVWRAIIQYRDAIDFSPERIEEINSRLFLIEKLERKYRTPAAELPDLARRLRAELNALETDESRINELQQELTRRREELATRAAVLSRRRHQARIQLEKALSAELPALGLENARFKVNITSVGDSLTPSGADCVEFLFSANPGEPLKPLRKVASGGELSRLMLAIKGTLARIDPVPILVFDEIDAGIGGRVAENVGRRLARLGQTHQVICITHLPQIAKHADSHFLVEKRTSAGRMTTSVRRLSDQERISELARMTGGTQVTKLGLTHAREMLESAKSDDRRSNGPPAKKRS
ncbi:MAG: DNA repair protein RecN, partial [candidate division WOR-3 bacterium]